MPEITASDVFLESLHKGGVDVIFANFGTDHAGLIESMQRHAAPGSAPIPRLVLAQHESVAINAALGYAHLTGRAQAAFVHVDVGTLNLGAGLHSASRSHLPVFLFAGVAPWTEFGERKGSRDIPPHWVQDVYDQAGSVREYVKWEYELRAGCNVHYAVARALQMANSAPQGPVYMTAAREPLEEAVPAGWTYPAAAIPQPTMPDNASMNQLVKMLRSARNPLLITSASGRGEGAMAALVDFVETFVVPVVEIRPRFVNLPGEHPLHLGYSAKGLIEKADLVLAVECDVPWVPEQGQPGPDCQVVWLDADPMGSHMPMRSLAGHILFAADAATTLRELTARGKAQPAGDPEALTARRQATTAQHNAQRAKWRAAGTQGGGLTAANVMRLVSDIGGDRTIISNESVTNAASVFQQLDRRVPGTLVTNAGSGLGMGLPAALGAKMARPDAEVIAIEGDGAYVLCNPTATHWSAQAYGAPFLTVILNNARWEAVINSTERVHPHGIAAAAGVPQARFPQPPMLSKVVESAGGHGYEVRSIDETARAIEEGLQRVRRGQSVVIDAKLTD